MWVFNWTQKEVLILAFDHRSSIIEELFGDTNHRPTTQEQDAIGENARPIFLGFCPALNMAAPREIVGYLVDEELGANILHEVKTKGFTLTLPDKKSSQDVEPPCCRKAQTPKGAISVSIVSEQDMGKKVIVVSDPHGKKRWFNKVQGFAKHLNKLNVSPDSQDELLSLVNTHFRALKKCAESSNIGLNGFGVGNDTRKEV